MIAIILLYFVRTIVVNAIARLSSAVSMALRATPAPRVRSAAFGACCMR